MSVIIRPEAYQDRESIRQVNQGAFGGDAEATDRVKVRNKLAAEIMKENGVSTNDLFELVKDHADWQPTDGVQFNAKGNEVLAKQVAESVLRRLVSQ